MLALAAFLVLQVTDFTGEGMKALEEGRYEAAAAAFQQAIAADPKDYFAHFNLAQADGFLHRDAEGIAEYRKTLELKPGLYEAEVNQGVLLMRQNQPADALPLFADAVEQKPGEFLARYSLAVAQYQTGALEQAEASYRRALEIDPKSAPSTLGLAHVLARDGKLADAAPYFRQAAQLDSKYHQNLLELADLYEKNQQTAEAAAIYREFPENPAVQQRLGEILLQTRQYTEALPALEAAYTRTPTETNRVPLAQAYVFTGQLEKALPLLEQAVEAEPANYELRMMYGRALRDRKKFAAAAAQFLEAARLKPADGRTWTQVGDMLYLTGSYPQALSAFDRAQQLGENEPGIWFMRAIMLDKLRQLKPAVAAYQRFLAMSQGKLLDQEFQARQRVRIIQHELERR